MKKFYARLLGFLAALGLGGALAQPLPEGATQATPGAFYDLSETHWAYGAVQELSNLGILTGYPDGRFDGTRAATRYELAVVAARLIDYAEALPLTGESAPGLQQDAAALAGTPLGARVAQLEQSLANTASLAYTRGLEARVVALEETLNTLQGNEDLPAATEETADGADVATFSVARAQTASAPPLTPGEVRLSTRPEHPFFVGISPGIVSTAGDVYLSVQTGYDNLIGPFGPVARLTFNGGNRELRFSVDALARLDALVDAFELYGGLGLGTTVRPTGMTFLLEAPFGFEYFVTPRVGLYLHLTTSYGFAPVNEVDAELATGVNLRF